MQTGLCSVSSSSDGNLATKQVVFLQRPVRGQPAGQKKSQVSRDGILSST